MIRVMVLGGRGFGRWLANEGNVFIKKKNTQNTTDLFCYFTSGKLFSVQFSSVQFSCSVMSNSLWPHGLQHAKLPYPSPTPRAYSNSCPLSRWCHPTISSSVILFFSHLQSFPASGSFPVSQFFKSSGQSIGVSASISVLPMNIQNWFPLGWLDLLAVQGALKSLL